MSSRTEMKCERWFGERKKCQLCEGFSSTPRCYSCLSSPAGIALTLTEARIAKLEARVAGLEAGRPGDAE